MHLSRALVLLALPFLASSTPLSPQAANAGANSVNKPAVQAVAPQAVGKPTSEGQTTFDGVSLAAIPQQKSTAEITSSAISRTGWTVTCDTAQNGNPCTNAIDGNANTFWHSEYSPVLTQLPHYILIDMKTAQLIERVTLEPRQDGSNNGHIGGHIIAVSTDGNTFTTIAVGTYIDDATLKSTTFTAVNARYVKVTALTEAGNRGPWTSLAEINVYTGTANPPAPQTGGHWDLTIDFPLVPVSAALETTSGRLLVWSSYAASTFGGSNGLMTITSQYDPTSQIVTETTVTNTGHDMFCEGLSLNFAGAIVAAGGNTDAATSIYNPGSNGWSKAGKLNIGRAYQAQVTLANGNLFTIGASWAGGQGGKNGELFNSATNTWSQIAGAAVAPMLTNDAQGVYRADNHGWLFSWSDNFVFQAGPSKAMNWYNTAGDGSYQGAGTRASDTDSMCGVAAMWDANVGSILTAGGSPSYQDSDATSNAHIITLSVPNANPTVQTIGNMAYARSFSNSVILPDGTVLIVGGQSYANPFSDENSQFTPELFNPVTKTFTQMAPIAIPRNYHSVAVLMLDGTVMNGGGGLCGTCSTNHYDAQIWSPPYLFTGTGARATRPVINSVSATSIKVASLFTVNTNGPITQLSLIRMSSTTHTVNTDQRRVPFTGSALKVVGTNSYQVLLPYDQGKFVPGYWMLFALNAAGVPSTGKIIQILSYH